MTKKSSLIKILLLNQLECGGVHLSRMVTHTHTHSCTQGCLVISLVNMHRNDSFFLLISLVTQLRKVQWRENCPVHIVMPVWDTSIGQAYNAAVEAGSLQLFNSTKAG